MAEFPHFYKVNQINKNQDSFSALTATGLSENIADYDRTTKYESIGSDDTTTENITVTFLNPDGNAENRTIDRVVITDCNAKTFNIYTNYWNGSTYDGWILRDQVTGNTVENHIRTFNSVSCGMIKIEMYTTIIVDEEKRISEFVATELIWEATMPMDVFNIKNKQKAVIRRLYNGKGQKILHYDKWGVQLEFKQITQTERDALRNIYDNYGTFIVILEPRDHLGAYDKPEEFYRVFFKNPWTQKYFTKIKTAGYNIKMLLEEV